ncbi:MAG: 5-formyltetrahydrofolate cyclo-ligase [Kangiellaceae bacterium]|nr:5-formyltetrahydrofolate cyclo-ligase [Kangiellaceae bacterium]
MSKNQLLKSEIRRSIRQQRKVYSKFGSYQAGKLLAKNLTENGLLSKHQAITCFLSFDGEISTQATIQEILSLNKTCYLPKIRPLKPNQLWFMPFDQSSNMRNNRFGIPEVNLRANHAKRLSELDLVLFPLVAFDAEGNRLGMGGGYYDATFSHLRSSDTRPTFVGLAWESQMVEELPSDPWDLPLDGVCTEQRFYSFN